jgi:flagellar FliJ protein
VKEMATQYKFRLQKLLEIREKQEEEKKLLFMEATSEKNKVEVKLDNLKDNYVKYSSMNNFSSTFERKLQHNYLNLLTNSIDNVAVELSEKSKLLNEKRDELIAAQVNRKTVEILKDKKKKEFLAEETRVEQLQNDEYALYGFIRQSRR